MTLPAEVYTWRAVYERELERIFRRSWINVGKIEDVPNKGDYFTTNVAGEPLLIVRDKARRSPRDAKRVPSSWRRDR